MDAWAQASNAVFTQARYGDILELTVKGRKFTLLKPSTYMNLSGNAVRYWLQKLDLPVENLMVVCDDLNLPFGKLRMRPGGSDGGHNGLKNIQELTGTQNYPRIRIGIGHDFSEGGQVDFVIGEISPEEKSLVPEISKKVIEGIQSWAFLGVEKAMNSVNCKTKE